MTQPEFEEVWQMLRRLENQILPTLVYKKRNRVLRILDRKIVRQTETADGKGWKDASAVSRAAFRKIWDNLTQFGFYTGRNAFACACLVNIRELHVEFVKGKTPRTIVLRDQQSASRINAQISTDEEDAEEFGDRERIVVDTDICSGKPTIRGTRIMVSNILGMLAGEYSFNRILREYPQLSRLDVIAAVAYASRVVDLEKVVA